MNQTSTLYSPVELGNLKLKNRIVMAPLTRTRASSGHMPNALMAEHYAQRASAGLIIVEATMIMEGHSAFVHEPGIYKQEQIEGWKLVTDAVHEKGGTIVLQIWHGGRACHPDLNNGKEAVAASPIAITNDEVHTPNGKKPYTIPRELSKDEIQEIAQGFKQAAHNAKLAGFDGIELHGANGYIIDNFLRDNSNQRSDEYGGSIENRARLLFEVLDAVATEFPSKNIGLRLSPINQFNSMKDSDPTELTKYLSEKLSSYDLAYLHLMRRDLFGEIKTDILSIATKHYKGNLMVNMGYNKEEAEQAVQQEPIKAVAFGVPFIANPDLVERFKADAALNEPDPSTFYSPGPKGYTDYPLLNS